MVHVYRQTDTQINPQSFSVRPAQQTVIRQQHQLQIGNGSTGAVIRTSLHFRSGGTQILNVVVGQLHGNVQRQLRESRCADSLPSLDCETHTPSSLWNGSAASRDTRPLSERRWEDAKGTTSSQNAAVHLLGPIAAQKLFHHLSQLRVCTRTVVNLPENAMRRSYLRHRNHFVLRNRRNRQIGIEKQILIETGWNGRLASTKNEHGESIHNRCIQSTLHTQPLPYLDTSTPLCTNASSPQMNEFTHTLRSNRSLHALDEPKTLITRPIRLVSFQ